MVRTKTHHTHTDLGESTNFQMLVKQKEKKKEKTKNLFLLIFQPNSIWTHSFRLAQLNAFYFRFSMSEAENERERIFVHVRLTEFYLK